MAAAVAARVTPAAPRAAGTPLRPRQKLSGLQVRFLTSRHHIFKRDPKSKRLNPSKYPM